MQLSASASGIRPDPDDGGGVIGDDLGADHGARAPLQAASSFRPDGRDAGMRWSPSSGRRLTLFPFVSMLA